MHAAENDSVNIRSVRIEQQRTRLAELDTRKNEREQELARSVEALRTALEEQMGDIDALTERNNELSAPSKIFFETSRSAKSFHPVVYPAVTAVCGIACSVKFASYNLLEALIASALATGFVGYKAYNNQGSREENAFLKSTLGASLLVGMPSLYSCALKPAGFYAVNRINQLSGTAKLSAIGLSVAAVYGYSNYKKFKS